MKRLGRIIGITFLSILLILFLVYFFSTSSVKTIAYFNTDYYRKTVADLDSLREVAIIKSNNSIQAGFESMASTPTLQASMGVTSAISCQAVTFISTNTNQR